MNPVPWLSTHLPEEETAVQRSKMLQVFSTNDAITVCHASKGEKGISFLSVRLCKSRTRLLADLDVKSMVQLLKAHAGEKASPDLGLDREFLHTALKNKIYKTQWNKTMINYTSRVFFFFAKSVIKGTQR